MALCRTTFLHINTIREAKRSNSDLKTTPNTTAKDLLPWTSFHEKQISDSNIYLPNGLIERVIFIEFLYMMCVNVIAEIHLSLEVYR